jgi:hypothetical protein
MEIKIIERKGKSKHFIQEQAILLSIVNVRVRTMQQPRALEEHITGNPIRQQRSVPVLSAAILLLGVVLQPVPLLRPQLPQGLHPQAKLPALTVLLPTGAPMPPKTQITSIRLLVHLLL